MTKEASLPFSRLRSYLWPIYAHELRKFLPLFLMAFFIGFNYNILRNMKDALLVTAEGSGAEVIPFIKVWGMVPGALLMTVIYSRLNNRLSRDRVFYAMVSIFVLFFALFTFVVYPIRDHLHPHGLANRLEVALPAGFKGLIAMFRYWTFSSFYIMSELWSSMILSMLFWGFANEVTGLGEAKRFYGFLAVGLNIAAIVSGQVSVFLTGNFLHSLFPLRANLWEHSLILLTSVVVLSGFVIMGIYFLLTNRLMNERKQEPKQGKVKMSMRENFAYLARSKYLLYMAVIVLSYNVVICLVEVLWKDQVRLLYPDPRAFNAYMSNITSLIGTISLFLSILVSGQMIRRFGWTLTAFVTPVILLATSFIFFLCVLGKSDMIGPFASFMGMSPLMLVVLIGSAQNCLSRAAKFTVFDATKEMAFIPLSVESKLKGKAAIDGVGSRIGKSGGSIIHQGLLMTFATIPASTPYIGVILLLVIGVWLVAVKRLGVQFSALATAPETPAEETPVSEEEEADSLALV